MIRCCLLSLIFLTCGGGTRAAAQSLPISSGLEFRLQNHLTHAAFENRNIITEPGERYLHDFIRRIQTPGDPGGPLSLNTYAYYGFRPYELSRLDMAMTGAGAGATIGLFLSAVGTTTGMFEEKSAWYLAGAATALGAILGGTVAADEPGSRLRYRWEP